MKYEKYKKLMVCIMLILIMVPFFSNFTYAAINNDYYEEIKKSATVSNSLLSTILSSDILADPLARLVYSIGSFIEYIVGAVVLAASGSNIFPWADAIVFNAIPMLDVNFINPYGDSLVARIQGVLKNLYASLFSLAEVFFGIAVLLMGIRLAISSIASEKAKYKDALVKWAIGLVLLFGIQFFISFIFYLNEQLVVVASNIASNSLKSSKFVEELDKAANSISDDDLVGNFINALRANSVIDIHLSIVSATTGTSLFNALSSFLVEWGLEKGSGLSQKDVDDVITGNPKISAYILRDQEARKVLGIDSWIVPGKSTVWSISNNNANKVLLTRFAVVVKAAREESVSQLKQLYVNAVENGDTNSIILYRTLYNARLYSEGKVSGTKKSIITGLASYFKMGAFSIEDGGWKPTKAVLENAVLYAILVIQSVTLLISYVKRLFYILILALIAPIVVVYDFAKKII